MDREPNNTPAQAGADDGLGGLRRMVDEVQGQLQPGGPEVNYPLVVAYGDGRLSGREEEAVNRLVSLYRAWNDAYWEVISTLPPEEQLALEHRRAAATRQAPPEAGSRSEGTENE